MILERVLSLVIGYAFGLFQTGYIYGKCHGIDIRKEGSGNAGTTNSLRVLGVKAGIITYLGDLLKTVFAVLLVWLLLKEQYPQGVKVLELLAGFGVVLGHNFPFYLNFKGGKGIACTSGVIVSVCPPTVPICLILFVAVVAITRYVSLGSILVVLVFLIQVIVLGENQIFLHLGGNLKLEFYLVTACFAAMAIWRHRANVKRLCNGTENKISFSKSKKQEG